MASSAQRPRPTSTSSLRSDHSTTSTPSNHDGESRTSSLLAMFDRPEADDDSHKPPTGHIHMRGEQIVSHHHNALDRFEDWQKVNQSRLRGLSTRQRWDVYISDPEVNKATMSPPPRSAEALPSDPLPVHKRRLEQSSELAAACSG